MKKLSILFIFLINFIFSQTGGGFGVGLLKNASIMVGLNQSFYGEDWKEFLDEVESNGLDFTENPFRKINFSIVNEYEYGVLGGLKYLNYGYDIEYDGINNDGYTIDEESSLELQFIKLFLTYPVSPGLYVGVEGGYFMEGKYNYKFRNANYYGNVYEDSGNTTIDREDLKDELELNDYDYGLIGQYYYNIKDNLLANVEVYYCLSEFSKDNNMFPFIFPNSFHYVNLGIVYKLGKK